MIEDYSAEDNGPIPALYVDSVTTMKDKVPDKSVDFVLFSPPYDYFEILKIMILIIIKMNEEFCLKDSNGK